MGRAIEAISAAATCYARIAPASRGDPLRYVVNHHLLARLGDLLACAPPARSFCRSASTSLVAVGAVGALFDQLRFGVDAGSCTSSATYQELSFAQVEGDSITSGHIPIDVASPALGWQLSGGSLAAVCRGWEGQGRGAPQRLGAFWPGRLWRMAGGPDPTLAALRTFADDPPAIWWGWSDASGAHDCLRWPELSARVRRFLETIPLDPPPIP